MSTLCLRKVIPQAVSANLLNVLKTLTNLHRTNIIPIALLKRANVIVQEQKLLFTATEIFIIDVKELYNLVVMLETLVVNPIVMMIVVAVVMVALIITVEHVNFLN